MNDDIKYMCVSMFVCVHVLMVKNSNVCFESKCGG